MALGIPVVASKVGIISEVIRDGDKRPPRNHRRRMGRSPHPPRLRRLRSATASVRPASTPSATASPSRRPPPSSPKASASPPASCRRPRSLIFAALFALMGAASLSDGPPEQPSPHPSAPSTTSPSSAARTAAPSTSRPPRTPESAATPAPTRYDEVAQAFPQPGTVQRLLPLQRRVPVPVQVCRLHRLSCRHR